MKEERIQLRIDAELKKQALRMAKRRGTTVSALVTGWLRGVVEADRVQQKVGAGAEAEQV